jgi:hypothetical protein
MDYRSCSSGATSGFQSAKGGNGLQAALNGGAPLASAAKPPQPLKSALPEMRAPLINSAKENPGAFATGERIANVLFSKLIGSPQE